MVWLVPAGAVTVFLLMSPVALSAFLSYWSLAICGTITGLGSMLVPVSPVLGLTCVTVFSPVLEYQPCLPAKSPVFASPVSGPV